MTIPVLDGALLSIVTEAFDFLVTDLAKDCTLIYGALRQECENCIFDYTNGKSSGIYKQGGPMPFENNTQCPLCQGAGYRMLSQTESVRLRLVWSDRELVIPDQLPIRIPYGLLETRGFLTLLPKIEAATELIAQTPIEGYKKCRYRRLTEAGDPFSIIQNRYFSCMWERVG